MKPWQTLALIAGAGALGYVAVGRSKEAKATPSASRSVIIVENAWDIARLPSSVPRLVVVAVPAEFVDSARSVLEGQVALFPTVQFLLASNTIVQQYDSNFDDIIKSGEGWGAVVAGVRMSMFAGDVTMWHVLEGTPNANDIAIAATHGAQSTLTAVPLDAMAPNMINLTRLIAQLRMTDQGT